MLNYKQIWIIGCGDIGRRVARLHEDNTINGVVSSKESVAKCEQLLIDTCILDLDSSYSLQEITFDNADIYYFAPPPPTSTIDTRLKYFLNQLMQHSLIPRRIVLISTTGVYGDSHGAWIDETTPINPQTERAIRRVSAEQTLQTWSDKTDCEFMILRVPGIYAKDRLPLARLEKGLPIVNASEAGFTNRIHADDLACVCKAAMASESSNQLINVTDGNPSTMTDYFNQIADFVKLPRPPQISMAEAEQTLSAGMVSYLKESRRIRNDKMLKLLGIELRYPNLKSSLEILK